MLVLHKDLNTYKYVDQNESLSIVSLDLIETCYNGINDILKRDTTNIINVRMLPSN